MQWMKSLPSLARNRFTQRAFALTAEKNTFYGECHFSALRHDIKMFPGAF